jgi:type II secretory pathway component GspD/PulD (secretin)
VLHQYKAAEVTIEQIFEKDPENEEAVKLRELAREGRHRKRESTIYDSNVLEGERDFESAVNTAIPYHPEGGVDFPTRDYWMGRVRSRSSSIQQDESREPDWVREYRQILASRKVTLNFPDTPFAEVVGFLQDITGLNITVASSVDTEETTVSLRLRDVLLQDALKIILEQTELAMTFKDQTLMITQPDEARGEYVLEIYDVQDLLSRIPDFPGDKIRVAGDSSGGGGAGGAFTFEDEEEEEGNVLEPDQLEEIVTSSVGEDNWDEPASIEIHRGQIIINQTRELHREIRRILTNLRRNTGLFVQVETRFIRMSDDFLRDIGVDLRGLGNSVAPNVPTPVFGQPQLLDPNVPTSLQGGNIDVGFGRQIPSGGNARISRIGLPGNVGPGGVPFFGSNMLGGRTQNILNGGDAYFAGERLNSTSVSGSNTPKGAAIQATILDPIQINAIIRAEEEQARRKLVDAPVITAANRQRVSISIITQRAYISDYELSSGGTGNVVAEVADPIIETFQEGVVLDVRPTISSDRKYITLDVKPTLATLVGGSFRQIPVNLGTISSAAINVNIEVPEVSLQEAFTSVTIPDGGTALLGGFRKINEKEEHSGVPFIDHIPLVNKLFSRDAQLFETFSLLIMVTARTINLREQEKKLFNLDEEDY